jgi:integrase
MPLTIKKRGEIWHYSGSVSGRRLRGSTQTEDKKRAERIASEIETKEWKRHLDGPGANLTFANAAYLYRGAEKATRFLMPIEDHWQDTPISEITKGAIQQSAIRLYPNVSGATRNRQVIVPTQAIINHAADLELCSRITVKRFPEEKKIKEPVTREWVGTFAQHSSPHLGALCLFMFGTGARISEALSVKWDDIDLDAASAIIRQTKISEERTAHLPPALLVAIANIESNRCRQTRYSNIHPETPLSRHGTRQSSALGSSTYHSIAAVTASLQQCYTAESTL